MIHVYDVHHKRKQQKHVYMLDNVFGGVYFKQTFQLFDRELCSKYIPPEVIYSWDLFTHCIMFLVILTL